MKNILRKNIVYLLMVFMVTSCAVDDDSPITSSNVTNFVNLSRTGSITLPQDVTDYTVRINLGQPSSTNTQVVYELNGTQTTVIIPPNTTFLDLSFTNGVGVVNKVDLVSVAGLYNNSYVIGDDNSVTFLGIPSTPIPSEPDTTVLTLAWEDAGFDMDFILVEGNQDFGGEQVDGSFGFANTETVRLEDNAEDGTYSLFVDQFLFTADVGALIIVTKSDGSTEYYGGTVMGDQFVMTFDKSGTDLDFTTLF